MDQAWDARQPGKIIQVSARSLANYGERSKSSNKPGEYFCIHCLLPVQFVYTGKANGQAPHFRHARSNNRNAIELECPEYHESGNNEWTPASVYNRVGLPMYLAKDGDQFELQILFPALEPETYDYLYKNHARILLLADKQEKPDFLPIISKIFSIERFHPNYGGTICRLDFRAKDKYFVKLDADFDWEEQCHQDVLRRWVCGARGIPDKGALFHTGVEGGLRVADGGFVQQGKWYCYLIQSSYGNLDVKGIDSFREGSLFLLDEYKKNKEWAVWRIRANEISNDTSRFFRELDCFLVEQPPELIPLWPPGAYRGRELCFLGKTKTALFAYKYGTGEDANPMIKIVHDKDDDYPVIRFDNKYGFVCLPVTSKVSPVMIKGKFVPMSFELALKPEIFNNSKTFSGYFRAMNSEDVEIIPGNKLKIPKNHYIHKEANIPVTMRMERLHVVVHSWSASEQIADGIMYGDTLILDAGPWGNLYYVFETDQNEITSISLKHFKEQLEVCSGTYIRPTPWMWDLVSRLETCNSKNVFSPIVDILTQWLIYRKIPVMSIPILEELREIIS